MLNELLEYRGYIVSASFECSIQRRLGLELVSVWFNRVVDFLCERVHKIHTKNSLGDDECSADIGRRLRLEVRQAQARLWPSEQEGARSGKTEHQRDAPKKVIHSRL